MRGCPLKKVNTDKKIWHLRRYQSDLIIQVPRLENSCLATRLHRISPLTTNRSMTRMIDCAVSFVTSYEPPPGDLGRPKRRVRRTSEGEWNPQNSDETEREAQGTERPKHRGRIRGPRSGPDFYSYPDNAGGAGRRGACGGVMDGDFVFVDPGQPYRHQGYVLASGGDGTETVRKVILDGGKPVLMLSNPNYPSRVDSERTRILGSIIGKVRIL